MRKIAMLTGAVAVAAGTMLATLAPAGAAPATGEENIVEVTADNYDSVINSSADKLVIFDFNATWCGPCQQMKPVIEKLAKEGADAGKWTLASVDVDKNGPIADKYGIQYIPTLIPVRNKAELADSRQIGFDTDGGEATLTKYIEDQLAKG
ncbi:co-chaperone YbbN [Kutzneria sp. 744]|uniref:thioredoxin family protein n=1 Tax=Kutzneria sp. (strain 744) TaxID=345341 RepID=UPI0004B0C0DE|nr:thioredoxin family protein [Kutzneria sp. 744]